MRLCLTHVCRHGVPVAAEVLARAHRSDVCHPRLASVPAARSGQRLERHTGRQRQGKQSNPRHEEAHMSAGRKTHTPAGSSTKLQLSRSPATCAFHHWMCQRYPATCITPLLPKLPCDMRPVTCTLYTFFKLTPPHSSAGNQKCDMHYPPSAKAAPVTKLPCGMRPCDMCPVTCAL